MRTRLRLLHAWLLLSVLTCRRIHRVLSRDPPASLPMFIFMRTTGFYLWEPKAVKLTLPVCISPVPERAAEKQVCSFDASTRLLLRFDTADNITHSAPLLSSVRARVDRSNGQSQDSPCFVLNVNLSISEVCRPHICRQLGKCKRAAVASQYRLVQVSMMLDLQDSQSLLPVTFCTSCCRLSCITTFVIPPCCSEHMSFHAQTACTTSYHRRCRLPPAALQLLIYLTSNQAALKQTVILLLEQNLLDMICQSAGPKWRR